MSMFALGSMCVYMCVGYAHWVPDLATYPARFLAATTPLLAATQRRLDMDAFLGGFLRQTRSAVIERDVPVVDMPGLSSANAVGAFEESCAYDAAQKAKRACPADRGRRRTAPRVRGKRSREEAAPPAYEDASTPRQIVRQSRGMYQWNKLHTYLQHVLADRSPMQKALHDEAVNLIIPWIFKDIWDARAAMILDEIGAKDYDADYMGIIVDAPRKMGKTTATAALTATILAACADLKLLVFSTTIERATALREQTAELIGNLDRNQQLDIRVVSDNKTTLAISPQHAPDEPSEIRCLAQGPSGRGSWAHIVIIDEFAFMKASFVYSIITPLLTNRGTKIIAISTPSSLYGGHMEQFKTAVDKRNGNKPLFITHNWASVCSECAKERRMDCDHNVEFTYASFRPKILEERIKVLYAGGSETVALRELQGASIYSETPIFDGAQIDAVFSPTSELRYTDARILDRPPSTVYLSIDPAGGGKAYTAMTSFFFARDVPAVASRLVVRPRRRVGGGGGEVSARSHRREHKGPTRIHQHVDRARNLVVGLKLALRVPPGEVPVGDVDDEGFHLRRLDHAPVRQRVAVSRGPFLPLQKEVPHVVHGQRAHDVEFPVGRSLARLVGAVLVVEEDGHDDQELDPRGAARAGLHHGGHVPRHE